MICTEVTTQSEFDAVVTRGECAHVRAGAFSMTTGNAQAFNAAHLDVSGSATVYAWDDSTVRASGFAVVHAEGRSTVDADGDVQVLAFDAATVRATKSVRVHTSSSRVTVTRVAADGTPLPAATS